MTLIVSEVPASVTPPPTIVLMGNAPTVNPVILAANSGGEDATEKTARRPYKRRSQKEQHDG